MNYASGHHDLRQEAGGMDRLGRLRAAGVSVWLDMLSRDLLDSGRFERLRAKRAVTGATSNPTIFATAIAGSDRYDGHLAGLLEAGVDDPREQFLELALENADQMTPPTFQAPASVTLAPPPAIGALIYPRPAMERAPERRDVSADEQSQAWLAALRDDGVRREQAIARLHDLPLRAARFELGRRQAALSHVRGEELDDIATQAAVDALMAVLAKLDDYRGASRFTTLAHKFALLEAGVKRRRRACMSARWCSIPRVGRPTPSLARRRMIRSNGTRRSARSTTWTAAPPAARSTTACSRSSPQSTQPTERARAAQDRLPRRTGQTPRAAPQPRATGSSSASAVAVVTVAGAAM
jgi:hypothetical protein